MKNRENQNANIPVDHLEKTRDFLSVARGNERLLVVEDEAPVRMLAVHLLRELGYHVTEAASGIEALEIWRQEDGQFDLLFSDKAMSGGISGLELSEQLTQMRPGLPIIITSGYGAEFLDELVGPTNVTYLGKPYGLVELSEAIRRSLDTVKSAV